MLYIIKYIIDSIINVFSRIYRVSRSFIAYIVLCRILGWRIKNNGYSNRYSKGKFVIIYQHTSAMDIVLMYLFSYLVDIDVQIIDTNQLPRYLTLYTLIRRIFDMNSNSPSEDNYYRLGNAVNVLNQYTDSIVAISPEGTRKKTAFIGSLYKTIAHDTDSDILIFDIDYCDQTLDLRNVIDKNVLKTAKFGRIEEIVESEMKKSNPLHPKNSYIKNDNTNDRKIYNKSHSDIKYVPIIVIASIAVYEVCKFIL